ncbi:hypothetical protein MHH81_20670 [Psychrobacillus sp. FSL H8-0484]|uniref:hypothetical protein n=1 Tax=Psychrobacillus sp. FSL H8-0484 TaxID=2921390 RepID=UPI0030FAF114
MEKSFQLIADALQAKFPEGTVEHGQTTAHAYIPVQVYIRRLEEVATGEWSWRLVAEPTYYEKDAAMIVRGELTIMDSTRSGIGAARYIREEPVRNVTSFKNAVSSAESDAIRNACDKFLMGWQDLAPYRDWSNNPGVQLNGTSVTSTGGVTSILCTRCRKPITNEDNLFLQVNDIRIPYCLEHVPKHLKKNK